MTRSIVLRCTGLLLTASIGMLAGCGGGDSTEPLPESAPALVSARIDPTGGELDHEDINLTVPAGALDEPATIAVYAGEDPSPFGEESGPVYRIAGLPAELGVPVTLRMRHSLTVAAGDTLSCFLGEERQAYSGGSGFGWHAVAGRDSAGWAIIELERGALDLGTKAGSDVKIAATAKWIWLGTDADHFEIGFDPNEVSRDRASDMLLQFDQIYDMFISWGFEFGDDEEIWPLDINIMIPVVSTACYVAAPNGAGNFQFDPAYLLPGVNALPVIAHEMFHCTQTFYDPRDPEEWGVLNRERMWLDEATAGYLEGITEMEDDAYPRGLDDDNYAAPLAGIAGHPELENKLYGYGMSQFITYLCNEANPDHGEEFILALYQHFKIHGDVTDAIDDVISPAVSTWCVDLHRNWAENGIYPAYLVYWFWHQWPFDAYLDGATGSSGKHTMTIADLGADLTKFVLEGDAPDAMTGLLIEARKTDGALPAEALPITVYGRAPDSKLARLAVGTDSVLVPDWPALHATYADIFVMVSRPYSTAPGHAGSRGIEVKATVMPDLSGIDVTTFTNAVIEVRTDNRYSNMSAVYSNNLVHVQAAVSWNGGALQCTTQGDTFSLAVNPETLVLGEWYGAEQYTSIGGNWIVKRLGGHGGIPLESWETNGLIYRLGGAQTCDYLTHVYYSTASDSQTDPYSVLTSYSCSDSDYAWERSGIYIHLYRSTTSNSED